MLDEFCERIECAGVKEAASGLNHRFVIARIFRFPLMTEQQVDISLFRQIKRVAV